MVIEAQTMTNSDFLAEVYGDLTGGRFGWVCTFAADPNKAPPDVWSGRPYGGLPNQARVIDSVDGVNTYFSTAVMRASADGQVSRRKECFERLAALVLDDAVPDDVKGFTWLLQTSPGKFQIGILLDPNDPDTRNRDLVDAVMQALAARGRANDSSGNAVVRYVRLPRGWNTKPRAAGPWRVQLESWSPTTCWTLDDACDAVGIKLDALRIAAAMPKAASASTPGTGTHAGEMVASLMQPAPADRAYHDSLVRLAASLISGGMFPGAAVELLYSLMDQVRPGDPAELQRWQARRAEIPRAVRSAEKYAPPERQPPSITVNLTRPGEVLNTSVERVQKGAESEHDGPQPMDWEALADVEPEPTAWRMDGWLPEGTVTLLSAHGGVGKSNVSLQLAVALAHGQPMLEVPTKRSRVLVLSGEDEQRTVHFRVANVCKHAGVDMRSLKGWVQVYDLTQLDCVLWRDGGVTDRMQWLADAAVRHQAEVIVIDNASDVFASNENDRAEVRGFMRALNLIAHRTGAAVLLLAHVDKASVRAGAGLDSNTTFSGSTAWNNSARSRWAMVRDEADESVTLRHEKCNLGPLQEEIRIEFDQGAKVFTRFGTVPGQAAAASLMRNQQRAAILRLLLDAEHAGQRLSMSAQANNNAWIALSSAEGFPARMDRREFFATLFGMQRDGLIEEAEYVRSNRAKAKCLALTDVGKLRAASGSGAPAMWKGAPQ